MGSTRDDIRVLAEHMVTMRGQMDRMDAQLGRMDVQLDRIERRLP